jgi:hypothetical protein
MSFLVVLGMHRCGTSSLTGALSLLGFSAGQQLMPANAFNVRGYFEDIPLNRELERFLSALNRSWRDERAYQSDWLSSDAALTTTQNLKTLFNTAFNFNQPTVIKNPRVSRLLPLLQPIWLDAGLAPKYILSLRSPLAVIHSLARRDSILPQRAALLYVAHLLEAELHTRNAPRVFVEYDDLLQDWRKVIAKIESEFSLDMLSSCQSGSECASTVDAFITKELNHFSEDQPTPQGLAIDLALEVYAALRSPQNSSTLSHLDGLHVRWRNYLDSLEPWLSETLAMDKLTNDLSRALFTPSKELVQLNSLNARSELFWACVEEKFAAARKVTASWAYHQKNSNRFVIPALTQPLKAVRWDITDRPAFCVIEKLWLEDSDGNMQWLAEPGTQIFTALSAKMHIIGYTESGATQVIASDFDARCTLNIPDAVLNRVQSGWILGADWQAQLLTEQVPNIMQQFISLREQLASAKERLDVTTNERDTLQTTAANHAEALRLLNVSFQQTQEEILRAEGQLALLKHLLLEDRGIESKGV